MQGPGKKWSRCAVLPTNGSAGRRCGPTWTLRTAPASGRPQEQSNLVLRLLRSAGLVLTIALSPAWQTAFVRRRQSAGRSSSDSFTASLSSGHAWQPTLTLSSLLQWPGHRRSRPRVIANHSLTLPPSSFDSLQLSSTFYSNLRFVSILSVNLIDQLNFPFMWTV